MKEFGKVYYFVGTIAEVIKIFPVMKEMREKAIDFTIIASGQNDIARSEMLPLLGINKGDIILSDEPKVKSAFSLFSRFLKTFRKGYFQLKKEIGNTNQENLMIVHGDTITTVMGSVIAWLLNFKIVHVEAGYRSGNYLSPFPEEIDRTIAGYFADYHFCASQREVDNVKKMKGEKINTQYNTVIDALWFAVDQNRQSQVLNTLGENKYFIFQIHRQENLMKRDVIEKYIEYLTNYDGSLIPVFICFGQTKTTLENYGLMDKVNSKASIIISGRLQYMEFINLMYHAEYLLTDGGSNQQEAWFMGKPTCILRDRVEGNEGIGANIVVCENNIDILKDFVENYQQYLRNPIRPKKSPSAIVVDTLFNH